MQCMSEMCLTWLTENTGLENYSKNSHLCTIAQLCRAISLQLWHVSTIGKKLVKQQYLLYMSPQYGELLPTSGWDHFVSFGHPCKFQRVSRLGSVTAWHSSTERQSNFAALNRERHLYSAGRPSRWALAHISSLIMSTHSCISPLETLTVCCVRCDVESGYHVCLQMYFHISNNATILLAGWKTSTPWREYFTLLCWFVSVTYNWIVCWTDLIETLWHCVVRER